MYFSKLAIYNFASIGYIKIDLSQPGLTLLTGDNKDKDRSNGAGKSSIFEALTWALYGVTSKLGRKDKNAVIRKGNSPCQVEVHLIDGCDEYTIARDRDGKTSRLWVLRNGEDIRGKNNAETTEIIQEILGVNYQEWIRGHYLPQRDPTPFGRMTDKELKTFFLNRLLNVDWVNDCWKRVRDDWFEKLEELGDISGDIEHKTVEIDASEEKVKDLQQRVAGWTAKWIEKIEQINDELKDLLDEYDEQVRENDERQLKVEGLKEEIAAINPSLVKERVNELLTMKGAVEEFIARHKKFEELEDKVGENCPTCGIRITIDHVSELKRESGSDWKAKSELNEVLQELEGAREALNNVEEMSRKVDLLRLVVPTEGLRTKILSLKETRDRMRDEENPYTDLHQSEKQIHASLIEENNVLQKKKADLEEFMDKLEFWRKGFSNAGIESFLLDSLTPALNERLHDALMKLTDGEMTARFNTVMQLKNEEYREKFNLEVENRIGGGDYSQLSGGESKRIDLATSMVMADLVRSRTNKRLDFVCFDEPFRGLDQEGIDAFLNYVNDTYRDIPVFLITHTDVDPHLFHRTITVVKQGGVTSLEE